MPEPAANAHNTQISRGAYQTLQHAGHPRGVALPQAALIRASGSDASRCLGVECRPGSSAHD